MTPGEAQPHTIDTDDGQRIAAYVEGNPDGPTLVMVHGWPDSHVLWDGVVALLADRFRIVRYDNRGVGASTIPTAVSDFTMARYADDFTAVITALSPGQPVHVLAHDWGSVAVWEYLGRPGAGDRVASFTSTSGPSPQHLMSWIRDGLARPYRPVTFARAAVQMASLSYMALFSIPVLAPLVVRAVVAPTLTRSLNRRDGIAAADIHHGPTYRRDAANSLRVYPANYFRAAAQVNRDYRIDTPVQLIVNRRDPFVRPWGYDATSRWVPRLWRRDVLAGHWVPMSHPQVCAAAVTELVDHLDGAPPARALARAQVGRARGPFGDMLVSVTGAGSGIGRETALRFARDGAEIVVSDIDEAGAKDTAARIVAAGGTAHAYQLDVSDVGAVDRFADEVCARHGTPDVVVNNAGIGQAGRFLDTPAEQFDRVMDVNLGGVVNCCRAFAGRLVDRGTGGHIVNVASMAAYAPLQSMNAYCTSKAAVYMFSDCLRAELAAAGVGLTTICPGVVDTNIVSATRIDAPAGKADRVAGRRRQLEKFYGMRRYGPDKVAEAIAVAVRDNTAVRPVTPEAYLLYGTSRVAPQVLRSTARGRVI